MKVNSVLFFALTISCLFSCQGNLEEYLVELPETVELGESEIYFNGELIDYEATISVHESSTNPNVIYIFGKGKGTSNGESIAFGQLPLETGTFEFLGENADAEFGVKTPADFFHVVDRDSDGYSYKSINLDESFLQIDVFDLEERVVQGRFRGYFKRTSKNGVKGVDLPKYILLQGVFHEKFTE